MKILEAIVGYIVGLLLAILCIPFIVIYMLIGFPIDMAIEAYYYKGE